MARSIAVKNIVIGEGMPCICVPLTETDLRGLAEEARQAADACPDLVEWRADCFKDILCLEEMQNVLRKLDSILGQIPVIFTIRTEKEGGSLQIPPEKYARLVRAAADTGIPSFVDVEVMQIEQILLQELIGQIHQAGVLVIGSNHHFEGTPPEDEMKEILWREDEAGADILKLAVMPHTYRDVAGLLRVTGQMRRDRISKPMITMAMGSLGSASRFSGEIFGSAVTFATVGKSSAPGQLPIDELKSLLTVFHEFV